MFQVSMYEPIHGMSFQDHVSDDLWSAISNSPSGRLSVKVNETNQNVNGSDLWPSIFHGNEAGLASLNIPLDDVRANSDRMKAVETGGLENRFSLCETGVRIPLPPPL